MALNTRFQKEVIAKLRGSGWELVIEDGTVFVQWPLNFGLPKNTENKKFIEPKCRETLKEMTKKAQELGQYE